MIENHVPTLATCQRLKDAGFPQETVFAWGFEYDRTQGFEARVLDLWGRSELQKPLGEHVDCAAPILTEILDLFQDRGLEPDFGYSDKHRVWQVRVLTHKTATGTDIRQFGWKENENPAEAAALLWLKLTVA